MTTISYNSDTFLTSKLDELISGHQLRFWAFINHLPEEEEKVQHKHLLIIPDTRIDTVQLDEHFLEPDPDPYQLKPLRCLPFDRCEDLYQWLLYAIHFKRFILKKQKKPKKYEYPLSDVKNSNQDYLDNLYYTAVHELNLWSTDKYFALLDGKASAYDVIKAGYCDMKDIPSLLAMEKAIKEHLSE